MCVCVRLREREKKINLKKEPFVQGVKETDFCNSKWLHNARMPCWYTKLNSLLFNGMKPVGPPVCIDLFEKYVNTCAIHTHTCMRVQIYRFWTIHNTCPRSYSISPFLHMLRNVRLCWYLCWVSLTCVWSQCVCVRWYVV